MFSRRFIAVYTLVICTIIVIEDVKTQGIQAKTYLCSDSCHPKNRSSLLPPSQHRTRSKIECAATCSKMSWCSIYQFKKQINTLMTDEESDKPQCVLYPAEFTPCLPYTNNVTTDQAFGDVTVYCSKVVTGGGTSDVDSCAMTMVKALEVNGQQLDLKFDFSRLLLTCASGGDVKIMYQTGNVSVVTKAHYYTFHFNNSSKVCVSAPEFFTRLRHSYLPVVVRELCVNTSQHVMLFHSAPLIPAPSQITWLVSRRSEQGIGSGEAIAQTGEIFKLIAAIKAGSDFKLQFLDNKMVGQVDIISCKDLVGGEITGQATFYESSSMITVSVSTSGSAKQVDWDLRSNSEYENDFSKISTIWLPSSCWKYVATTDSSSTPSSIQLTALKNAISNGKRIRVSFVIRGVTIYGTAKYIGVHNDMVVAHIAGMLDQNAWYNAPLFSLIPQWKHFIVALTGEIKIIMVNVGASNVKSSTDASAVEWFEEKQNYSMILNTTPTTVPNQAKLAPLVSYINGGIS